MPASVFDPGGMVSGFTPRTQAEQLSLSLLSGAQVPAEMWTGSSLTAGHTPSDSGQGYLGGRSGPCLQHLLQPQCEHEYWGDASCMVQEKVLDRSFFGLSLTVLSLHGVVSCSATWALIPALCFFGWAPARFPSLSWPDVLCPSLRRPHSIPGPCVNIFCGRDRQKCFSPGHF